MRDHVSKWAINWERKFHFLLSTFSSKIFWLRTFAPLHQVALLVHWLWVCEGQKSLLVYSHGLNKLNSKWGNTKYMKKKDVNKEVSELNLKKVSKIFCISVLLLRQLLMLSKWLCPIKLFWARLASTCLRSSCRFVWRYLYCFINTSSGKIQLKYFFLAFDPKFPLLCLLPADTACCSVAVTGRKTMDSWT